MSEYILEMTGIKKRFGGIQALGGVNLQIRPGEVHALLGENGAGKSTLMKILGGSYSKDEGTIYMDGKEVDLSSPEKARSNGIAVIYQEQALVDCLTVADNIMMGQFPSKGGVIREKEMRRKAQEAMEQVGASFKPQTPLEKLGIAQKQFVEIAKAVALNARILIMDEPTSVLTLPETQVLFALIKKLRAQGMSIIYISHRLEELAEIADRCTVLKDGTYVCTKDYKDVTKDLLIEYMTGRKIKNIYPEHTKQAGEVCLEVKNLCGKRFQDVSFQLRRGEIVGFSGLVGSGRTEVARAIFGADRYDSGEVLLEGKKTNYKIARDALRDGIVYITEDRKGDGLFLQMSISNNIVSSILDRVAHHGVLDPKAEKAGCDKYIQELRIKCAGGQQPVGDLSGGNQQKVMIARAMITQSKVIIIDEPTRGVDVGAKTEIYKIIRELADAGAAIMVISSELPEVIGISDRIIVMHEGRIKAEIGCADATEQNILSYATGGN